MLLIRTVVSSTPPIVHVQLGDPLFCYHLQLEKGMALHLKKLESPSPRNAMWQDWLELDMWFCRRFFKFSNFQHYIFAILLALPLEKVWQLIQGCFVSNLVEIAWLSGPFEVGKYISINLLLSPF